MAGRIAASVAGSGGGAGLPWDHVHRPPRAGCPGDGVVEPRGAGCRALRRIRPVRHRNGAARLDRPLQGVGKAGGRALRGGGGGLGGHGEEGPPPRGTGRRGRRRGRPDLGHGRGRHQGSPPAPGGDGTGRQLALDDAARRHLPRRPAGCDAHPVVARGAVAVDLELDRARPARGARHRAHRRGLRQREGPVHAHQAGPARQGPGRSARLRRLRPVPAAHGAVRGTAQHRRIATPDRRPGGVLGLHHHHRGGGDGAVSGSHRSAASWPCRA